MGSLSSRAQDLDGVRLAAPPSREGGAARRGRPGVWRALVLLALLLTACGLGPASAATVLMVEDGRAAADYTLRVRYSAAQRALERAGLSYSAVADRELPARDLRAGRLALLASNPTLSPAAADWLRAFVIRGGRLLVAPPLPPALHDLLGVAAAERFRLADDSDLSGVVFDTARLPSLPTAWRQLEWAWQPFTPGDSATVLGRWTGGEAEERPAAAITHYGAALGATLTGDDRLGEAQVLLALATALFPELWHEALPRVLEQLGEVSRIGDLGELRGLIDTGALSPRRRSLAEQALTVAVERRARAWEVYRAGRTATGPPAERYAPALELAWEARRAAQQAYYLAQQPVPGEFRGVWLQNLEDIAPWDLRQTVTAVAENNFNALFYNAANPGYANYPSNILPRLDGDADPLAELVALCRARGIECHVWLMVNYIRPRIPDAWRAELTNAGRLQESSDGRTLSWLRPGDARNRELMASVAAEIAERYDIDGIHLDYIRYSGPEADFSAAERAAFEAWLGRPVSNWPADTDRAAPLRGQWVDFRRRQVSEEIAAIADAVAAVKPEVALSAAVYPIWVNASYEVGQQPAEWARAGWVDFLTPMNYQTFDEKFLRFLRVQQRMVGEAVPLYPGIAAWRQETPADTIAQIRLVRGEGARGFVLFHLSRRLVRQWMPALRLGVTADAAELDRDTALTAPSPAEPVDSAQETGAAGWKDRDREMPR